VRGAILITHSTYISILKKSSNSKVELPLVVFVPLVWDMEDMYGVSKGLDQFSRVVGTIELDDFIRVFNTWCDM